MAAISSDATALDRFEKLMLTQEPATPWTPVTDYSVEAREQIEAPNADLVVSTFQPSTVLDYGCGLGHLVRLLRERSIDTDGFDPLQPHRPEHGCYEVLFRWSFDLVICREVLEHVELRNVLKVVSELCVLSSRYIYLTTRFAKQPDHFLSVDTSDDLDPTHCTMLNQDFLRALFVLHGFKRDRDKEQAMDWMQKGRVLVYERV